MDCAWIRAKQKGRDWKSEVETDILGCSRPSFPLLHTPIHVASHSIESNKEPLVEASMKDMKEALRFARGKVDDRFPY